MAGKRAGRRSIDAIMSVILLILLVLAFFAGTWFFVTRTQRQMEASGEAGAERRTTEAGTLISIDSVYGRNVYVRNQGGTTLMNFTVFVNGEGAPVTSQSGVLSPGDAVILTIPFEMKKGDSVKVTSEYGAIAQYSVERSRTARCGNGICEFPDEESCTKCAEDCGMCLLKISARSYPMALKLGQTMNFEVIITAAIIPETVQMKVLLPNGSEDRVTLAKATGTTWTGTRSADQNGVYVMTAQIREKDGPQLPDVSGGVISTAAWWNPAWRNRRPILASEYLGTARSQEYVAINYTDLALATGACREMRLTNLLGVVLPYQVLESTPTSCYVMAAFDAVAYLDNQVIGYVYYNNPAPPAPDFSTDLKPFNEATGCLENDRLRLCLGKLANDGGIMWLSSELTGKENNLLKTHSKDTKYYRSGIQPQMDYREGFDILWCTNYTPIDQPKVIVDGPVYQKLNYSFGTVCEGTPYNYNYTIGMYANKSGYDFELGSLTPLFLTPSEDSFLAGASWNPAVIAMTKEGAYCSPDSCYLWSDLYSSPQNLGIGSVSYGTTPYAVSGSLTPPGGITMRGTLQVPEPISVIKVRNVFSSRESVFAATNAQITERNSPLAQTVRLGEEETPS
jgi:hypothetical protein